MIPRPPSQVRSGLAAKALKTARRPAKKAVAPRRPQQHHITKTVIKTPVPKPVAPKPATALAPNVAPVKPPTPVVKINENGQLDLPYGDAFGNSMLDYQTDMNSQLQELQSAEQNQSIDYAQQKRDLAQNNEVQKRTTLNTNAARGTAFSSAYGSQVADNSNEYNKATGDLETANTQARAGFSSARTGIETAFNNYLRRAVLDRGVELAGQAGQLGYGQAAAKPAYKAPAPKKATVKKAAAHVVKKAVAKKRVPAKKAPAKKKGK